MTQTQMFGTFGKQGDRAYVLCTKGRGTPYIRPSKPLNRRQWVYAIRQTYANGTADTLYFRQIVHAQGWLNAIAPNPQPAPSHDRKEPTMSQATKYHSIDCCCEICYHRCWQSYQTNTECPMCREMCENHGAPAPQPADTCDRCGKPFTHDPMRGQCICAMNANYGAELAEAAYYDELAQSTPQPAEGPQGTDAQRITCLRELRQCQNAAYLTNVHEPTTANAQAHREAMQALTDTLDTYQEVIGDRAFDLMRQAEQFEDTPQPAGTPDATDGPLVVRDESHLRDVFGFPQRSYDPRNAMPLIMGKMAELAKAAGLGAFLALTLASPASAALTHQEADAIRLQLPAAPIHCAIDIVFEDGSAIAHCANGQAWAHDPEEMRWELARDWFTSANA